MAGSPACPGVSRSNCPRASISATIDTGFGQWGGLGLRRVDGKPLPRSGEATLFLPGRRERSGVPGHRQLHRYQGLQLVRRLCARRCASRRSHCGRAADPGEWPSNEPTLGGAERVEVQRRLAALGFYTGETDGKLGSKTREAVRAFQLARGLTADGYANPKLLKELRAAR
jgi:hypothetical protein